MSTYKVLFVLKNLPQDPDEADRLSDKITGDFGSEGWELVSTAVVTNPGGPTALLLTLQKEDAG
ncbi:MAG: hypothetical protein ACHBNF_14660 [Chromatiales bacterium]